jgi:hypothetical protein
VSINIEAVRRAGAVAVSEEIPNLRERLEWADRDPTIAEAMCFTDQEVAYILNVSTRSVGRFVERGDLRAFYLTSPRRTRRFTLPDIKAFVRSKVSQPS